jgi:hypothetical protein
VTSIGGAGRIHWRCGTVKGTMDACMHPSALKEAPQAPALSRTHRLVLAAAAAGAVMTLCWAALQVRAAKEELRQLQSKAAAASSAAPERTAEPARGA